MRVLSKFKKRDSLEIEMSQKEWRNVTFVAIPTLSLIVNIQAFFAESSIEPWQVFFAAACIGLSILGYLLGQFFDFTFNFAPLVIFLLLFPVFVGDVPDKPWMSIGLMCMSAVIYFSGIKNLALGIGITLLIAFWQSYVASLNLASVTDSRDINFFYSYFAFTWLVSIGIGSLLIRRRYMKVAENVHSIVDESLNETIETLHRMQISNLKESNNLKLHGTLLNTLIYLKNLSSDALSSSKIREILRSDLEQLDSGIPEKESSFESTLESDLQGRVRNRINIQRNPTKGSILTRTAEQGTLEIVRELILNLEKHTSIGQLALEIDASSDLGVRINFSYEVPGDLTGYPLQDFIRGAERSSSIKRLLNSYQGSIDTTFDKRQKKVNQSIYIPYTRVEDSLKASISEARFSGLNDFAINYVRIAIYVGYLALVGYLLTDMDFSRWILLFTITSGTAYCIEKPKAKKVLFGVTALSFLVLPFVFSYSQKCADLLQVPWLWNILLTIGFLVALRVKGYFLKWVPLAVLAVESYYYPTLLEPGCRNILDGSTPAIPLIVVLAIIVIRIRKRQFSSDRRDIEQVSKEIGEASFIQGALLEKYEDLIRSLSSFVEEFDFNSPNQVKEIEFAIQIQKIRTYLICAEKFDSLVVRTIYDFAMSRLNAGVETRITLLGDISDNLDKRVDTESLMEHLNANLANVPIELSIAGAETLQISIEVNSSAKVTLPSREFESVAVTLISK